jgi:hypothetical protein
VIAGIPIDIESTGVPVNANEPAADPAVTIAKPSDEWVAASWRDSRGGGPMRVTQ